MSNVQSYSVDEYEALLAENKQQADEIAASIEVRKSLIRRIDLLESELDKVKGSDSLGWDTANRVQTELTRLRTVKVAAKALYEHGCIRGSQQHVDLETALAACEDSEGGQGKKD